MNERLPYEEQLSLQWNDLPLPDVDGAWADMKRRLEEDDDRPLFPFWLRGCAGWALMGVLLLGLGWWIFRPEHWFRKKEAVPVIQRNTDQKPVMPGDTGIYKPGNDGKPVTPATAGKNADTTVHTSFSGDSIAKKNNQDTKKTESDDQNKTVEQKSPPVLKERKTANPARDRQRIKEKTKGAPSVKTSAKNKTQKPVKKAIDLTGQDEKEKTIQKEKADSMVTDNDKPPAKKDPPVTALDKLKPAEEKTDSAMRVQKKQDSLSKKEESPAKKQEKDTSTVLVFSAGIGLQQQLPLAGQKFTAYNAQGRKGILSDYIPAIYLRMERPRKWFLQGEFRYAAPQQTKEFLYNQEVVPGSGQNPQYTTTTAATLKKTYYHQLPLVFNYYLAENWSLGAGLQWNKFYTALSEETVTQRNNFTQLDSLISDKIINFRTDTSRQYRNGTSRFSNSYFQAVFETQYQYKRFSFGARYNLGLQPYIRFSLPNSPAREEKNHSLQVFIRYRLWKSKK